MPYPNLRRGKAQQFLAWLPRHLLDLTKLRHSEVRLKPKLEMLPRARYTMLLVESEVRFEEHTPFREAFAETSNAGNGKRSISLESSTGRSYHQSSAGRPEKSVSADPFMGNNDMDPEGRSLQ
ncbi:hypothetical protein BWQ96_03584 [Gracilariopsis chorda]|uniref:Uncharacterized protein n=1 Tax=Gracilariopsis chorda TaxID=448386 RepID=A0A2V3IX02_9FLOR|nr:hypothetical protein BWQ96_03584 [Gracilariopsis chorda]|eukprot:PXF46595.1 hypothetical protein BWQ96_03584 [Gracilariopsis chorda]